MLKDAAAREQLERDGWVVIEFFTDAEFDRLVAIHDNLHQDAVDEGIFFSNRSPDEAYKARVQELFREHYRSKLDELFVDAEWIDGVFIIKAPGAGEFSNHQDWSLVDEAEHRSLGIWAPLLDVDAKNGTFCVLSGSHRFHETYRSPTIPSIYARDDLDALIAEHRQVLEVRRGQAVIFDHALIHATTPNRSDRRRSAAFCGIKPRRAEMRFFWLDPQAERVEAFRIERDFLYRYDYQSRPEAESLGHLPWEPPEVTVEGLEDAILRHGSPEASFAAADLVADQAAPRRPWWRRLFG
ncbi:MAG: phytanoyl-CoA dioxygenase family protein [Acidobacteriota bacterium]